MNTPELHAPPVDFNVYEMKLPLAAEYKAMTKAIDTFFQAWDRHAYTDENYGRPEAMRLVEAAARAIAYGDCCNQCGEVAHPIAAEIHDEHMQATYSCCRKSWTVGWNIDILLMF